MLSYFYFQPFGWLLPFSDSHDTGFTVLRPDNDLVRAADSYLAIRKRGFHDGDERSIVSFPNARCNIAL